MTVQFASNGSTVYTGEHLSRIAFPMGGIGAGMICLEGTGALSHVSLAHRPDIFNEPPTFGALHVADASTARVLEGPVPMWKAFGRSESGKGSGSAAYGLPRFAEAVFKARFPFATVELTDPEMPVTVDVTGWSPFIPGNADDSSLPVCGLEYRFRNSTDRAQQAVFSFHCGVFLWQRGGTGAVEPVVGGFALHGEAWEKDPPGSLAVYTDDPQAVSDCAWFRGGWFDALTMVWNRVSAGKVVSQPPHASGEPGSGASLYVPFELPAGGEKTVRVLLAWYVPTSTLHFGNRPPADGDECCAGGGASDTTAQTDTYVPWYATRFGSLNDVAEYWRNNYNRLRAESQAFSDCFYDTTLPPEAVEAVAANLSILKSPTCLRQHDGRFWGFEGCGDTAGCCGGSCTHVWNYAQAMPHLFPELERTLRETEFFLSQDESGHQQFRSALPIGPCEHNSPAAADGQLGGIVRVYREWRISGDTEWMKRLWPRVRQSLCYCIETWDPDHTGTLVEPHHNTYDIEFWGPDGMCTSIYLSALQAAVRMGRTCDDDVSAFEEILERGKQTMESDLWNGDYFIQQPRWKDLRAPDPTIACDKPAHDEYLAILQAEGPKYQYGTGCLSDGVLGDWLARVSGLPPVLDHARTASHVAAVFRHNFKETLRDHANPQRPGYALGQEGGLLLCSWPHGGKPSLPFVYAEEVWTGIEYQVASHLIMMGQVEQGLRIVRTARGRYDGRFRNPFDEYECGHWYARAMSSYALLQALSGARYDAVDQVLYLYPKVKGDFRAFLSTATGYGTVGVRNGEPFIEVASGTIPVKRIEHQREVQR